MPGILSAILFCAQTVMARLALAVVILLGGTLVASAQSGFFLQAEHSGKCAHIHGAGSANGTYVTQWDCQANPHFIFRIHPGPEGRQIRSVHTGKCVHVHGASQQNGGLITQWDCVSGRHLTWRLREAGNGRHFIVSDSSGKCMHVQGAGNGNGDIITQWDCVDLPHLRWRLISTTGASKNAARPFE